MGLLLFSLLFISLFAAFFMHTGPPLPDPPKVEPVVPPSYGSMDKRD